MPWNCVIKLKGSKPFMSVFGIWRANISNRATMIKCWAYWLYFHFNKDSLTSVNHFSSHVKMRREWELTKMKKKSERTNRTTTIGQYLIIKMCKFFTFESVDIQCIGRVFYNSASFFAVIVLSIVFVISSLLI